MMVCLNEEATGKEGEMVKRDELGRILSALKYLPGMLARYRGSDSTSPAPDESPQFVRGLKWLTLSMRARGRIEAIRPTEPHDVVFEMLEWFSAFHIISILFLWSLHTLPFSDQPSRRLYLFHTPIHLAIFYA